MKDVLFWLLLVLCVDGFLFMGQLAVNDTFPGAQQFYGYQGSLVQANDIDGNFTLTEDVVNKLPTGTTAVSPDNDGNFFTDIFSTAKNWLVDNVLETTGVKYILAIVNAVPNFLKVLGLPREFVFIVGSIWHSFTIFMIALLIMGRD